MTSASPPSPTYHPGEELLYQHAGGALPLARRVLLESHLSFCPECREAARELSRPGGQHLRAFPGAAAPAALWQKIAAKLEMEMAAPRNLLEDTPLPAAARAELPPVHQPLAWNGLPGSPTQLTRLVVDEEAGLELYLIHNPPSSTFPYHKHLGSEELLILKGGLTDQYGHYLAGDLQQYGKGSAHEPLVDAGPTCWALTCVEGGVSWER
jgi:putative transcriptional regulator